MSVPASSCSVGLREPADYLEGETVRIVAPSLDVAYVKVRCVQDCRDAAGKTFYARWDGAAADFPGEFGDPGPDGTGANPREIRAPRYNSTWEASAMLHGNQEATRTFRVWLVDVYKAANLTVHPGSTHRIRASGFDPGAPVDLRIDRRLPNGTFVTVVPGSSAPLRAPPTHATPAGVLEYDWEVPKGEAGPIDDCGARTHDCYRVRISGAGKQNETVPLRVAKAVVAIENLATTPAGGEPAPIERTQNATLAFNLNYPAGRYEEGPKLYPDDLLGHTPARPAKLRVAIERYNRSDPAVGVQVNETRLEYVEDAFHWRLTWTVPRDLPLEPGLPEPSATYRLRLLETRDKHGNVVPARVLGNYTVTRAEITPVLVEPFSRLPRAEEGVFAYSVRYHNGSVLGPAEARTKLTGCLVRDADAGPAACAGFRVEHVEAAYRNETWVFSKRYPRGYPHVNESHLLLVNQSLEDQWGNRVRGTRTDPWQVVPGEPRIQLATVQRGQATDTLVRGHPATVEVVIRYADGAPFNSSVTPNHTRVLAATLTKRGPNGAIQSEGPFQLSETDPRAGRWMGTLPLLGDDTSTPAGRWTLAVEARDNETSPNVGTASFDRHVAASLIRMEPRAQPPVEAATGSLVRFRFRLLHENGTYVAPATIGAELAAHVLRYDREAGRTVGAPVSARLVPHHHDSTGEYSLEYEVPIHLFDGDYAFVVTGADVYGNRIAGGNASRPFSTYSEIRTRSVLAQPPPSVRRGDSATVVFDGREGDMGTPAVGVPAIRLERLDEATGQWVIERQTMRVADPTTTDHVGVFPVTTNTVIGLYRFRLEGRDDRFDRIHAVSANFTVEPTTVARALVLLPPDRASKGETIALSFERMEGDRITQSEVLLDGKATTLQRPSLTADRDRFNASFQIPFEAPQGKYSVRLGGRDLYGNLIEVYSPFVQVDAAQLTGRILGQPSPFVARGEPARLLFGIANPDGSFYLQSTPPRVFVRNGTGVVGEAAVAREGIAYTASWTPSETAPEEDHLFEVTGAASGGNAFPTMRSEPFRVVPGELERAAVQQPPVENLRMSTVTFAVPAKADDDAVGFELGYFGPATDLSAAVFETRDPISRTPIPHSFDAAAGRYVARFVTDQQTPVGAYRIYMNGTDASGNLLHAKSGVFVVRSTTVIVNWDNFPPLSEFGEGRTLRLSFVARYRSGEVMTDEHGTPSAVVLLNRVPVKQRPDVEFRDGRWFLSWTAPDLLSAGAYAFSVGGADAAGNQIAGSESTQYTWNPDLGESFSKAVPGPGPALLLAAALACALALRRRPDRRG